MIIAEMGIQIHLGHILTLRQDTNLEFSRTACLPYGKEPKFLENVSFVPQVWVWQCNSRTELFVSPNCFTFLAITLKHVYEFSLVTLPFWFHTFL